MDKVVTVEQALAGVTDGATLAVARPVVGRETPSPIR
jgi:hypothetical protein